MRRPWSSPSQNFIASKLDQQTLDPVHCQTKAVGNYTAAERTEVETRSVESRLETLREWFAESPADVAAYVLTELKNPSLNADWRRILIYAAEEARYESPADREELAHQLLRHAAELRNSSSPEDKPAVMSAIRRAGSVLSPTVGVDLIQFLENTSKIDTRLVALQAVVNVYSDEIPEQRDVGQLAQRCFELASKHWDLDVFKAGEISALAIEATVAAVALGDSQAGDLISRAQLTQRPLLLKNLKAKLQDLRGRRTQTSQSASHLELVDRCIAAV